MEGWRKMEGEEGEERVVKPTRSFRYEDYNTRRVFLRSYPLQWDLPADQEAVAAVQTTGNGKDYEDDGGGGGKRWRMVKIHVVVVAVVEWGKGKLLLLRRLKRKVAFYLLSCHYPALAFNSANSGNTMLTTR